jgi:hypothetical protein
VPLGPRPPDWGWTADPAPNPPLLAQAVADNLFFGDREKAGLRILNDYRMGYIDLFALELPDDLLKRSEREAKARAQVKLKEEARRLAKQQKLMEGM